MTRRGWLRQVGAAAAGARLPAQPQPAYRNYFGDLHNHNHAGFAQGSIERSFEMFVTVVGGAVRFSAYDTP